MLYSHAIGIGIGSGGCHDGLFRSPRAAPRARLVNGAKIEGRGKGSPGIRVLGVRLYLWYRYLNMALSVLEVLEYQIRVL